MELPDIRQALSNLPPDVVAQLLREVLDRAPAQAPTSEQWSTAAQRVIDRYQDALKRLAQ